MSVQARIKPVGLVGLLDKVLLMLVLLVILLFLWCVYKVWATPVPGPILPAESAITPLVIDDRANLDTGNIIVERPLFWRARTPVVEQSEEVAVEVDDHSGDLAKVKILGLYPGGAMISGVKGKTRIKLGEKVFGWELERVLPKELHFKQNGQTETLQFIGPKYLDESVNDGSNSK